MLRTYCTTVMPTYINSQRSRLGGLFKVERSSSLVIFLSSCTSTFAAKIVKKMLDEVAPKRLILSFGAGAGDSSNLSDCDEKNPLVRLGCVAFLRVSVLDILKGFSEPTLYTHRSTSASMRSAVKERVHMNTPRITTELRTHGWFRLNSHSSCPLGSCL